MEWDRYVFKESGSFHYENTDYEQIKGVQEMGIKKCD